MTPFANLSGVKIIQKSPGTVFQVEGRDDSITLTDENAVVVDMTIYLTPKNYEALKERCAP